MASSITHAVVGFGIGVLFSNKTTPKQLPYLAAGVAAMPDLDVITYAFGSGTDPILGHRGWTHSIFFAGFIAPLLSSYFARAEELCAVGRTRLTNLLFTAWLSHILLDMTTDGNRGVALFAPVDSHTYFLPIRLLVEAPIVYEFFSTSRTIHALVSEITVIWLPMLLALLLLRGAVVEQTPLRYSNPFFWLRRSIYAGSALSVLSITERESSAHT